MAQTFTHQEIAELAEAFEQHTPQQIIIWAVENFAPNIALSSSFQTQSLPLLHMVSRIHPAMRIFFLNTGYHFWDTLIFREQLTREWNLNVVDLYRDARWELFRRNFGRELPRVDPNLCCFIHKVQPMQRALDGLRAWITGIRRDQTKTRAQARIVELQEDGLIKVNPLLNWRKADVEAYRALHRLPEHPLLQKGYRSIGCAPCTQPVRPGEDERAGRWAGTGKTECGLHTEMFQQKDLDPEEARKKFLVKIEF
ncbi:MAG TPA: phosphoadenylyl-sulfate reductase [Anaerolineales bacterium]|nr:phosphoadenylyl-sulfate reductase [Anaerolineales bacterium]